MVCLVWLWGVCSSGVVVFFCDLLVVLYGLIQCVLMFFLVFLGGSRVLENF